MSEQNIKYPTLDESAPRTSGRRYRRVIDAHIHWYPQEFVDLMIKKGPAHGAVMSEDANGPVVVSVPGCTQKSSMRRTMTNFDDIIKAMDNRKVDTYALSMTNPLMYWAPPGFGLELAAAHNDACVEAHRKYPDRFYGCIILPMQDVKLAVQELERMAKFPCMRSVFIAEHINGKNLHEKEFWPVYERAEALGLPLFLTNLYPTDPVRMKDYFMINVIGNPLEAGYAATSLIYGGVLDAFPKLDVYLPHAGGIFPWLIGRLDIGIKVSAELEAHEEAGQRIPAALLLRPHHAPPGDHAQPDRSGRRRPHRHRHRLPAGHVGQAAGRFRRIDPRPHARTTADDSVRQPGAPAEDRIRRTQPTPSGGQP